MALNIIYTGVEDWQNVCVQEAGTDEQSVQMYRINPVTQAIGFTAMVIGMSEITKANVEEWWARIYAYQQVANMRAGWLLTPGNLRAHIGLHVNVSPMTKAAFRGKLDRLARDYARDEWRRFEAAEQATSVPGE